MWPSSFVFCPLISIYQPFSGLVYLEARSRAEPSWIMIYQEWFEVFFTLVLLGEFPICYFGMFVSIIIRHFEEQKRFALLLSKEIITFLYGSKRHMLSSSGGCLWRYFFTPSVVTPIKHTISLLVTPCLFSYWIFLICLSVISMLLLSFMDQRDKHSRWFYELF